MAILVFVHHFLFSDAYKHSILKKYFDIVESGQYQRYAWGIKVFEDMFRTTRDKLRAKLTMYRLGGLPLAFQVRFNECFSTVDKTLASRVGNSVQRILNWKVKEAPTFVDLTSGKLMTSIYQLEYRNLTPTSEEISRLNLAAFFEDVNFDLPLGEDVPTFDNNHSNVASPVHPQKQQPHPRCNSFASPDSLKAEISELSVDVGEVLY
ncbi:uncharacterized protein LOC132638280 isoform X1 [Lycium barbarum]|uniref:uncharacterized protein LOC132638280 isoform X1 n=1 Tax=Lycium barbarum TaxID=112863 RepID=UPI00293EC698|nr:uncharacterized protein LOC132638280 isoform X1 [Lycium barbarum]